MTIRKTAKWFFVIVLTGTGLGLGTLYWLSTRTDEMLKAALLEKFAEAAPHWDVKIGRARFDWSRRVRIDNLTIRAREGAEPVVTFPEVVVTVDREQLTEHQQIVVRTVQVISPRVNLVRKSDGKWNWQELFPVKKSDKSCPEWKIEDAAINIRLQHADGSQPGLISLSEADLQFVPSGKRRYLVKGKTTVSGAGSLKIDGDWDLNDRSWSVSGESKDVAAGNELLELIAGVSPELRDKLARVDARLRYAQSLLSDDDMRVAESPFQSAGFQDSGSDARISGSDPRILNPESRSMIPDFGLSGTIDMNFSIAHSASTVEPEFKLLVNMRQGQIENPLLPFALHDLAGKFYWDNRQFVVRNLTAKNGVTHLTVDGKVVRKGSATPGSFSVTATNLVLDDRIRRRLTPRLRRAYDDVRPTGQVDVSGRVSYDGNGGWQTDKLRLTAHDCTANHRKFPYPITEINGTIRQQPSEALKYEFAGFAGRRPVTMTGLVREPGPASPFVFDISVDDLPLDQTFRGALSPEIQKLLQSLALKGVGDARLRLAKSAGVGSKVRPEIVAFVHHATLKYEHFPYPLSDFSGTLAYSPQDDIWTFQNLKAKHGAAELSGSGSYSQSVGEDALELTVVTEGAQLDKQLEIALPSQLRGAWDELSPTGTMDVVTTVRWSPGRPVNIALPEITITGGSLNMQPFPYPLDDVTARLSYKNERLDIHSMSAKHDDTSVRTKGSWSYDANGGWGLQLNELYADDLVPDRRFREALPDDLRDALKELNPRDGNISLSGSLAFRGSDQPNSPVTAEWNIKTVFSGGTVTAGLDLEKLRGSVTAIGRWDGQRVTTAGRIDFDSMTVWGYQLTQVQGPYQLNDTQLIVGSQDVLSDKRTAPVKLTDRLTARAIKGRLTFDSVASLQAEPAYRLRVTLSHGKLEEYARRYMSGQKNLSGDINGGIDLHGRGSKPEQVAGRGQLQIRPAALFELPVIAQILKALSFATPGRTAFKDAFADFNIANGQVEFNQIELRGDSISLRGRGTARFVPPVGKLDLNFYSMLPRDRFKLPFINVLVGEATKGWVGVEVRGTVDDPQADLRAAPQLDKALKQFLRAFETRPAGVLPRLMIPPPAGARRRGNPRALPLRTRPPAR